MNKITFNSTLKVKQSLSGCETSSHFIQLHEWLRVSIKKHLNISQTGITGEDGRMSGTGVTRRGTVRHR